MSDYAIVVIDSEGNDVSEDAISFTDSMKQNPAELVKAIQDVIQLHEDANQDDSEDDEEDEDEDD